VLFIKLVRILGAGVAAGLICHLLYSAARKNTATRQNGRDGKEHRKYVESSVVEGKGETSGKENS